MEVVLRHSSAKINFLVDMRWFISDTHFGHRAIIDYCKRPFSSVEEMDAEIISRWNESVRNNDEVFFLGDFGFGSVEYLSGICSRLNGFKVCVRGNHDRSATCMKRIGFDLVVEAATIRIAGANVLLRHEPRSSAAPNALVMHGHVHCEGKPFFVDGQICMCVELWNYRPVSESVIFKHVRKVFNGKQSEMLNM